MVTRKLSGKHHRTNILHISQRVGIIAIVVATKYNPNCTPSNIKNIWAWQSQTDEISTILDAAQPNPVLSKGASKATAADDQIRWALTKWVIWKWTIHEYPKSILHWQFCWHFQTRVCSKLQTLSASGLRTSLRNPLSRGFPRCVWFCATKDASFVKIRPFRECVLFSMENMTR